MEERETFSLLAGAGDAGDRVDRFLALRIATLSRARIQALIAAGCARCDEVVVAAVATPVRAGARYTLAVPPPLPAVPLAESMPLAILHEDRDLIVLDKPAGLVVHPAPGSPDGTLVNALLAHCGASLEGVGGEQRPGIVHRLDKDTSGVMVVAKTQLAMVRLAAAFAGRDIERSYLALCWGLPDPAQGEIEAAIGRDPRDRKRMAVVAKGGRPALTRYAVRRHWSGAVSVVDCRLATGRTHQIRVHLAARGHPLLGDPVYLRRRPAKAAGLAPSARAAALDFPRQALHAATLGFSHPRSGLAMRFDSRMPPDLAELLASLDGGHGSDGGG